MRILYHVPLLTLCLEASASVPGDNHKPSFVANIVSLDPLHRGKKCTGTLVTNTTVLTTADCLTSNAHTRYHASLTTVSFGGSQYRVGHTLVAEGYVPQTQRHNVGIVQLASPVPKGVAVPVKISSVWPESVYMLGHGPVDVLDEKKCQVHAAYDVSTQVCAKGGMVCRGDEGAPLVGKVKDGYVLAGMVSYATGIEAAGAAWCGQGDAVYFEKASAWVDWVAKTAGVHSQDIVSANEHSAGSSSSSSSGGVEGSGAAGLDSASVGVEAGGEQGFSWSGDMTAQSGAALGSNSSVNTSSHSSGSSLSSSRRSGWLHGLGVVVIMAAMI
ncbi:hypothetical protein IW150_001262 [Coemansia sp. RSA 2607]|nr:hypothetical protein IW150_001262 [Coemansia sp. RSA 2607]KAJ2397894.1 hypothetical protein GGI05_000404 [Coemansia sp. RSA 2603]